nr:hypothetical protein [Moraxella ovis]
MAHVRSGKDDVFSSAAITESSNCRKNPPILENDSPTSLRIYTENASRCPSAKPKVTKVCTIFSLPQIDSAKSIVSS